MIVHFTKHILNESSLRIKNNEVKQSQEKIKEYYKYLFCSMYNNNTFNGKKVLIFAEKGNSYKICSGNHKFVYVKNNDGSFLLITYIFKNEVDKIEMEVLKIINYKKGKKTKT